MSESSFGKGLGAGCGGMLGCIVGVIIAIVALVVGVVVLIGHAVNRVGEHVPLPQAPNQTPASSSPAQQGKMPLPTTLPTPSRPTTGIVAAPPPRVAMTTSTAPATAPAAPEVDKLYADLCAAQASATKAKTLYAATTQAAAATVKASQDYQAAVALAAKLEADVKAARAQNSPDVSSLSAQWISAKSRVAQMEASVKALPEVKAASDQAHKAELALDAAQRSIDQRERQRADQSAWDAAAASAREEAARERERAEAEQRTAAACAQADITYKQYQQIENGMTYDQVFKILGRNGEELSRVDSTVLLMWKNSGFSGANMNIIFQNARVIAKAQFGLPKGD